MVRCEKFGGLTIKAESDERKKILGKTEGFKWGECKAVSMDMEGSSYMVLSPEIVFQLFSKFERQATNVNHFAVFWATEVSDASNTVSIDGSILEICPINTCPPPTRKAYTVHMPKSHPALIPNLS